MITMFGIQVKSSQLWLPLHFPQAKYLKTSRDEMVQTCVTSSFVETLPSNPCLKERMEYLESKIGDSADQHDKAGTMELRSYGILWAQKTNMLWYMLWIHTIPKHTRIYQTCRPLKEIRDAPLSALNHTLTRNSARSMQRWKNCRCHRGDGYGYSMAFPFDNFS